MSRDQQDLHDMLQSAELVKTYSQSASKESFENDVLLQDAVIRRLLIIAEAARRISEETQQLLSEIQWREINGMRS